MKTPQIGDDVIVIVNPSTNNGESLAAGKITKVVSQPGDHDVRVNVRVFLDTGADRRNTNVILLAEKPDQLGAHSGDLAYQVR